jgi:chemosensory pili system protein ChpA (sensor histidine kinase/response regulator)
MAAIERVVQSEAQPMVQLGRTPMIELDGEAFPFAELTVVLGHTGGPRPSDRRSILIVRAGERRIAVAVDAMLDQQEVVVKSLGPHLRAVRGVLGATIRTNGELLLVLNTAELLTTRALVLGGRASRATPGGLTAGGALRALVVDDSLSVRKVLARSLERDGWEVRQARDGVDALEVLQGYQPNIVLMDIEMPRMDGFELAGILRDVADYGHPPVVMITSRAGEKHRQRATELDVAGYVVKPYQEQELLQMLRQVALSGSRR